MQSTGHWIAAAALLSVAFGASPARAIEVSCVEASRYKHIMRIFGNDTARFAAFFRADPSKLPHPESCRALIVTGQVMKFDRGSENQDFTKLARVIANGGGWVTTLYLASPGGNVGTGLRLGELTRMFWLNTYAVADGGFEYVPDFLGASGPGSSPHVPPELEAGLRDFQAATQGFSRFTSQDRRSRRCVSACTFLHAAGIYRYGEAHFHRGRRGTSASRGNGDDHETSMSDLVDQLHNVETLMIAFYRKMDAGDGAIDAFQKTATETTSSVMLPMMPRYIGDYLKKQCTNAGRAPSEPVSRGAKRDFPDRFADIQCIASSNSRERLLQFAKFCPSGCDISALFQETSKRVSALVPRAPSSKASPQRRYQQERLRPYGPQGSATPWR